MIGHKTRQALEAKRQREALGLKAPRSRTPRSVRLSRIRQEERFFDFSTCARCGAVRLPGSNGKLPPHQCRA